MAVTESQVITKTTWALDPSHTTIEFGVKHMMVTTVKGRFTEFSGTLLGDLEGAHEGEIDVEIQAASIDTRSEQRDAHLRSADFLDAENFPTITFRGTRIEPKGDDELDVYGDLTIHGVTNEALLKTTINGFGKSPFGTEVVGFTAETKINRKDFGLNWNVALETGGWLVGDTIKVTIEGQAVKQS